MGLSFSYLLRDRLEGNKETSVPWGTKRGPTCAKMLGRGGLGTRLPHPWGPLAWAAGSEAGGIVGTHSLMPSRQAQISPLLFASRVKVALNCPPLWTPPKKRGPVVTSGSGRMALAGLGEIRFQGASCRQAQPLLLSPGTSPGQACVTLAKSLPDPNPQFSVYKMGRQ